MRLPERIGGTGSTTVAGGRFERGGFSLAVVSQNSQSHLLSTRPGRRARKAPERRSNLLDIANAQGEKLEKNNSALARSVKDGLKEQAHLTFDQALGLMARGEIGQGMVWLAEGLTLARKAEHLPLETNFRTNLAGWRQTLHELAETHPHDEHIFRAVAFVDRNSFYAAGEWKEGQGFIQMRSLGTVPPQPKELSLLPSNPWHAPMVGYWPVARTAASISGDITRA